jgi:hypothetical protein
LHLFENKIYFLFILLSFRGIVSFSISFKGYLNIYPYRNKIDAIYFLEIFKDSLYLHLFFNLEYEVYFFLS